MALKTPFIGTEFEAGSPLTPEVMDVKLRQNLEDLAIQIDALGVRVDQGGGGGGLTESQVDSIISTDVSSWALRNDRGLIPSDKLMLPIASESRAGIIELASNAEADAGMDTTRAMTAALVQRKIDAIPTATASFGTYEPEKNIPGATLRAAGNDSPRDIWSNGTIIWATDTTDAKLYAYNLKTKIRVSSRDLNNINTDEIWSNGTTLWALEEAGANRILRAYVLLTGARDSAKDITIPSAIVNLGVIYGFWTDETTIWVLTASGPQGTTPTVRAFNFSTGAVETSKDIVLNPTLRSQELNPRCIWSDGVTMWVGCPRRVFAYNIENKTFDESKSINLDEAVGVPVGPSPTGLWADSSTLYMVDVTDNIYAFSFSQVDGNVRTGVFDWARVGDNSLIPTTKLPVSSWALTGNTDDIPIDKIQDATPDQKGVFAIADQNDADTGTSTLHAMTPALTKRVVDAATTGASIKGKLEGLSGSSRLQASAIQGLPTGGGGNANKIIALATPPTNLTTYNPRDVIRTDEPPAWFEVIDDGIAKRHGVRIETSLKDNRFGYGGIFGGNDVPFGVIERENSSAIDATESPIAQLWVDSSDQVRVIFKQSDLPSTLPTMIFMRVYSGEPSRANEVETIDLRRDTGRDFLKDGVQYRGYAPLAATSSIYDDRQYYPVLFARFFTVSPSTQDQESNALNIFADKVLHQIDAPDTKPTTEADTSHDLDFEVWESSGSERRVLNLTYQSDNDNKFFEGNIEVMDGVMANVRYYQVAHPDASERGRWSIVYSTGSTSNPFNKTDKSWLFKLTSATAFTTVAVGRDSGITNAYAVESTTANTSDPAGLSGTSFPSGVSINYNFQFSDNSLAYPNTETVRRESLSKDKLVRYLNRTLDFAKDADIPTIPTIPTAYTPRRVSSIPTNLLAGDKFYLTDDWQRPAGVEITPQDFVGTELDGLGVGDRGWYSKPDAGFEFGSITPDLPDDFVLISNTRVYVKRNTQATLLNIEVGGVKYALTRVPQAAGTKIITNPAYASTQPDVDYYTIAGAGLPAGDWDGLKFEVGGTSMSNNRFTSVSGITGTRLSTDFTAPLLTALGLTQIVVSLSYQNLGYIDSAFATGDVQKYTISLNGNIAINEVLNGAVPDALFVGGTEYAITEITHPSGTKRYDTTNTVTASGKFPTGAGVFSPEIKIKFSDGRFYNFRTGSLSYEMEPSQLTFKEGQYFSDGDDVQLDEYEADEVNTNFDLKLQVQEQQPGAVANRNLTFIAEGSDFKVDNPFDGILKITYHNTSANTETYQRWTVQVPLEGFNDDKAPIKLRQNNKLYTLSYFETGTGHATYRTPVTLSAADRLSAEGTVNNCNVQLRDGTWVGHSGIKKVRKTLSKENLRKIANDAEGIHVLPPNPIQGQRFVCLNDLTFDAGAIMTVGTNTVSGNTFIGASATVGELRPPSSNIDAIGAFIGGSRANLSANIAVERDSANTKVPNSLTVDGVDYTLALTSSTTSHFYYATSSDLNSVDEVRHFFLVGSQHRVNVGYTDGTKEWPEVTFQAGDTIVWTGFTYLRLNLNDVEVARIVNSELQTRGILREWYGTQAQYNAITAPRNDTKYFIRVS